MRSRGAEALKYYRRVSEHYGLDIHQYEHVDRIEGSDGAFTIVYDSPHRWAVPL